MRNLQMLVIAVGLAGMTFGAIGGWTSSTAAPVGVALCAVVAVLEVAMRRGRRVR